MAKIYTAAAHICIESPQDLHQIASGSATSNFRAQPSLSRFFPLPAFIQAAISFLASNARLGVGSKLVHETFSNETGFVPSDSIVSPPIDQN